MSASLYRTIINKERRIIELEEALEFISLACEAAHDKAIHWSSGDYCDAVEIIEEKCKEVLDKA